MGDVHLVSVDSMQVYRGMDIGTAKPTLEEQARVPHHCIDLVDADEDFTVADYAVAHRRAIGAVAEAGATAMLVGGTGLYHRIVVDGLEVPGEWPDVRASLDADPDTAALHRRLVALDPQAAARMEPTNRRRIVRALEVTLGSGHPFSSFGPGLDAYPPSPVVQIGLRWPRDLLAPRIERRVRRMVERGFVAEVTRLREKGLSRTAGQALGYREIGAALDGRIGQEEAIELTIVRTRQFAVRQDRWFRRDPRIRWIDVEHDPVAEAAPAVLATLEHSRTPPTPA
jgi:tRNA dimethylallyltransferase